MFNASDYNKSKAVLEGIVLKELKKRLVLTITGKLKGLFATVPKRAHYRKR
jgi:hypothetical protein